MTNKELNSVMAAAKEQFRKDEPLLGKNGASALMLVCARLRYVATKEWGTKRYLNMKHLYEMEKENELKREQEKDGKNENVA